LQTFFKGGNCKLLYCRNEDILETYYDDSGFGGISSPMLKRFPSPIEWISCIFKARWRRCVFELAEIELKIDEDDSFLFSSIAIQTSFNLDTYVPNGVNWMGHSKSKGLKLLKIIVGTKSHDHNIQGLKISLHGSKSHNHNI